MRDIWMWYIGYMWYMWYIGYMWYMPNFNHSILQYYHFRRMRAAQWIYRYHFRSISIREWDMIVCHARFGLLLASRLSIYTLNLLISFSVEIMVDQFITHVIRLVNTKGFKCEYVSDTALALSNLIIIENMHINQRIPSWLEHKFSA